MIRVEQLSRDFVVRPSLWGRRRIVHALADVTLDIRLGETLGLVGESGSGKSTLGRTVAGLLAPTRGHVLFEGAPIPRNPARTFRRACQFVFQDPAAALDPRMRARALIEEPLVIHRLGNRNERRARVDEIARHVGLDPASLERRSHEFSGGQRQRIGIARALMLSPRLLVLDEPVSALDVSVQAQIINLLADLRDELRLTLLFISHDLRVVSHFCDRIAVMYLGRIVEVAPCDELFRNPRHPYTRWLLASMPAAPSVTRPSAQPPKAPYAPAGKLPVLISDPPSPFNPPSGCAFHPRCGIARADCADAIPALAPLDDQHSVACPHTGVAP